MKVPADDKLRGGANIVAALDHSSLTAVRVSHK